jgi:hypothetical protein
MTRGRRWGLLAAAAFVALVVWVLSPASEQPFHDYLAERRAAGLPATWVEFAGPAPPDSENAFVDLDVAWRRFRAEYGPPTEWKGSLWNASPDDPLTWPECLDADGRAALAATEERLRPGLVVLARACGKPRFVAPETVAVDGWMRPGDGALLSALANAMGIKAAADPDPAGRLEACRALLVLAARSETYGPGTQVRSTVIAVLRDGVESGLIDAAAARAACDEWLRVPLTDGLRRALRGEAVKVLDAYAILLAGRWTGQAPRSGLKRVIKRLKRSDPDVEWEPGIAADVVASSRGWEDLAATKDDRAPAEPVPLIAVGATPDGRPFVGLEKGVSFAVAVRFAKRDDAQQALARIALAAAEYRAKHGNFPASLDELAPMFADGVPLDPFSDAPFAYERTASGIRIASAGLLADEPAVDEEELRKDCLLWELGR